MNEKSNKKKILIFSMAYYPRFIGGAEVAIKEITDRLSGEFEFHMITLRYDSSLPRVSREGAVLVHRIGLSIPNPSLADLRKFPLRFLKPWYQIAAFFEARRLHREHHYDAVWSMMAHTAGVPGGLFKRFYPSVGYVLTLQEGDPPEHIEKQMRVFGGLFRAGFVRADMVQAISEFLCDWGVRMGARRAKVIPNGVDLSRFVQPVSGVRRSELREKMGAKKGDQLLITVSRLVHKNGIDTVIEALAQLPSHVRFAVLGDGPDREKLQALAAARGVEKRVMFMGEISNEIVPEYLHAADIFIRASRSEGQGISFIEAMAAGLPTVGTAVGGIPDFLHDGETGFICAPDQPISVAGVITQIIEHPIETNTIAEGGQRFVQEYGWDALARRMKEEVFDAVLS